MGMNNYSELLLKAISVIENYDNICITSHVNPDGDSIGSVLALGLVIKKKFNKHITMLVPDKVPNNLTFLPGIDLIETDLIGQKVDLFIALDCGDENRLGVEKSLLESVSVVINIDHHITNTDFGHINIVNPKASSTGEIVYDLINHMNVELDKDIATCIYTAISSDTGSFKYDNTTSKTHMIASKLLDARIDTNIINTNLYQSRSIEKTNLLVASLNTLEFFNNKKIGLAMITKKMLEESNATSEETDFVVNFIRDIDIVEVACILKEIDNNTIKISFRSKKHVDVSQIAKAFNGGGHAKASGCTIYMNIEEGKQLVLEEIVKAFR